MEVPPAGVALDRRPRRAAERARPVVRRQLAVLALAAHRVEARPLRRSGRGRQRGLEPRVVPREVVGHDVDEHAQPELVRLRDERRACRRACRAAGRRRAGRRRRSRRRAAARGRTARATRRRRRGRAGRAAASGCRGCRRGRRRRSPRTSAGRSGRPRRRATSRATLRGGMPALPSRTGRSMVTGAPGAS